MQEVDINKLVDKFYNLNENIPKNIIIIGKIDYLNINYKYDQLDLSRIECDEIYYKNQEEESIKNHILPISLKILIYYNNKLTLLPDLPHSLKRLYCDFNNLTSIPNLPSSLEILSCSNNKLTSFTDVQLPDSLEYLDCFNNQLTSLPDFSHIDHKLELGFNQDLPISYISYNPYLKFIKFYNNMIIIEGYINNPIINQEELNQYMDWLKMKKIKSARK